MMNPASARARAILARRVAEVVQDTPIDDIHTHLYSPAFGELLLWGVDDLLVYHYLVAEAFRQITLPFDAFGSLGKREQADLIWNELFEKQSPVSEACRGVLTTLSALGFDLRKRDLAAIRKWFSGRNLDRHVHQVLDLAGVRTVCMTNSPFDDMERPVWEKGHRRHERFKAALRVDPLLLDWTNACKRLYQWGYPVSRTLNDRTFSGVRRFLMDWSRRMDAGFVMVSLPPDFTFPDGSECARLIQHAVLPHCLETGQPFAVMPGVRRGVNPALRLAGDGVGLSRLDSVAELCSRHPRNKFAVTALARENQHELCVLGRKFRNLHLFGCWWFLNTPSLITEMTRMRMELLGLSFTPQHSDARVLEQLIYKWRHSRAVIQEVLVEKYQALAETGWVVSHDELRRDARALFGGGFATFSSQVFP